MLMYLGWALKEDNMRISHEVGDTSSPCHVAHEQMEHIATSSEAKKVSIDK
jgi:hypothetical protein